MIKAILFDFDGTLANTLPYYVKAYDQALQKLGFKWDERIIVQNCFGKKELDICKSLGMPEKTEEFTQAQKEYIIAHVDKYGNAPNDL